MNSHRLTTNYESYLSNENYIPDNILKPKISALLSKSNLELNPNGQILIKSSQNYLRGIQVSITVYNDSLTFKQEFETIRV